MVGLCVLLWSWLCVWLWLCVRVSFLLALKNAPVCTFKTLPSRALSPALPRSPPLPSVSLLMSMSLLMCLRLFSSLLVCLSFFCLFLYLVKSSPFSAHVAFFFSVSCRLSLSLPLSDLNDDDTYHSFSWLSVHTALTHRVCQGVWAWVHLLIGELLGSCRNKCPSIPVQASCLYLCWKQECAWCGLA